MVVIAWFRVLPVSCFAWFRVLSNASVAWFRVLAMVASVAMVSVLAIEKARPSVNSPWSVVHVYALRCRCIVALLEFLAGRTDGQTDRQTPRTVPE